MAIGLAESILTETVTVDLDAELLRQALIILGRVEADGEDHHLELLLLDPLGFGGVADDDVLGLRVFADDRDVAADEPDVRQLLGPLIEGLEALAVGTDVVVKDRAGGAAVMILRQDDLFLGVGAADRRAVPFVPFGFPSGADALDPGDVVGMASVRGAQDLAFVWTGGAHQPFVVHAGDDVLQPAVAVLVADFRIKNVIAGGENDRPHLQLDLLRDLVQIDGVVLARILADPAFLFLQVQAALIDVGDQRDGLGKIDMHGLVVGDLLVVLIRIHRRAVLDADAAAGALVLDDVARFLGQLDGKIACLAIDAVNFGIGKNLDIGMPADLDQFR